MHDDRKGTAPSEEFYDDPNRAMDLGYSFRGVRISAHPDDKPIAQAVSGAELERRERAAERFQEIVAPIAQAELEAASGPQGLATPDGRIIPTNDGAYCGFRRRSRELIDEGKNLADASRIASDEMTTPSSDVAPVHGIDPYFGACRCGDPGCDGTATNVREIAFSGRRGSGGGGGGGGGRRAKAKGTKMCRTCHLERKNCQCYGGRNELAGARVSRKAKEALDQQELSAGEILEAVIQAALTAGGPHFVRRIVTQLERAATLRRSDCPTCIELGENIVCGQCLRENEIARGLHRKKKCDECGESRCRCAEQGAA